ncbi:uric acid-xanthine permease, partial [Phenoliferia sp. Uapishka_3]
MPSSTKDVTTGSLSSAHSSAQPIGTSTGLKMPDLSKIGTKEFWLGDYHALAMVGGIITPPILLGGSNGAGLSAANQQYLISACLIWCAFGTCLQVSRIRLPKGYYLGTGPSPSPAPSSLLKRHTNSHSLPSTGVLTVTGTSFAFVATGLTYINGQFKKDGTGMCQFAADGTKLPCPEVFGALLGTASVVSILAIAIAFVPVRALKRMFPPLITGSLLLLIGITLVTSGVNNWAGGAGGCKYDSTMLCPSNSAPHGEYWGSAPLIGLGFSVFSSIILLDLVGPPLVKNCSVFLGLLIGIVIAAGCGYFDASTIRSAPGGTFLWTTTFPLSVKGDLVLPYIAAYLVIISETIGNITATCDVSRIPIEGADFSSRIQGGLLADTLFAAVAGLATVPPLTTFSQNIGVVALTRNASRQSGYACAFFLFLMGVIGKFGAIFVAMPVSVLGGMTTFLFTSVAVAGIRILAYAQWTRRARFIATCSLSLGFAAIVVPDWFSTFFTFSGPNASLAGFLSALTLIVEESYLICLVIAIPLNLIIPYGSDDTQHLEAAVVLPTAFGPSATKEDATLPSLEKLE